MYINFDSRKCLNRICKRKKQTQTKKQKETKFTFKKESKPRKIIKTPDRKSAMLTYAALTFHWIC